MFNVSAWSIRNPIPAVMLFVLLTFAGLIAFNGMKVKQFPDIELPIITISAQQAGTAPAQLETDVARKLENAVASLQGLKHITTTIQEGSVQITIEFQLEKSVQEALDEVRSAVQTVRADLPADVRDPIVQKNSISASPILVYALSSDVLSVQDLSWYIDNSLSRDLLAIRGVGAVTRVGGETREVRVLLNPTQLVSYGITVTDISHTLRSVQQDVSAGRMDLGISEQSIRIVGAVSNAQALADIHVPTANGKYIRLGDIATIVDTVAEQRSAAFFNGKPVVGFEISRARGESDVEVGLKVREFLKTLAADQKDLQFSEVFDFITPVQQEYDASIRLLIEGALLAIVVVWLFLRDWRATWISAVALPMSVIPTFWGMAYLDFSLNVVSLLAMSLVIGVLVDDAIVEIENIMRHLRMGKTPYQAAMEAADEIGLAVIATTFTLIAVFLPTAFMSGIAGKFFKEFGWTAAIAVFVSLVVARVLTPMMAAYLLKVPQKEHPEPRWLERYMSMVRWSVVHPWKTISAALAFFVLSLLLIPFLPQGFLPPDDMSQTQVQIELAPGSTLQQTQEKAEQARLLLLRKIPEIQSIYTTIGSGSAGSDPIAGAGLSAVRKATLTIQLLPRTERVNKGVVEENMREALISLAGVRTQIGLAGSKQKYIIVLQGDDPERLNGASQSVLQALRTLPGIGAVSSSASLTRPEIAVIPQQALLAKQGVTTQSIADTIRVAMIGDYDISLAKLNLSERQVPIVVRLGEEAREDIQILEQLPIPSKSGMIPLGSVARLEWSGAPAEINRYDRRRNVTFEIEVAQSTLGDVQKAVDALPIFQQLPIGVSKLEVGDAEVMAELFMSFMIAMGTGLLCIYIVLVLLFKSFLHPITLLMALPLSFGGAFIGLILAHKSFSMPSLIGMIMLMGIATKNSILLVDYALIAQAESGGKLSALDAILDACHKRARPIIMTTIAMGAGMLPIAIGLGNSDPSFRSPMAIAVIGGLITSTLLSLLVIPAVFLLFERARERWMPSKKVQSE